MSLPPTTVSILIPTYNRAEYLRQAISSALAQTYAPIEVVVLDDASPDGTPAVVAEFAHDPRLRYIRHARNVGIAGNWRIGIQQAKGSFFCLLHDDDTFAPEFVAELAAPMREDAEILVAFCDHWIMDSQGRRLPEDTEQATRRFRRDALPAGRVHDFARAALVDSSLPVGAALFRKNRIRPEFIDENAKGAIDAWLFYQCVKTGGGAYYVPERLMNYRVHAGGMSSSAPQYMGEGHIFRQRAILADPAMRAIHADTRGLLAGTLTAQGIHQLTAGQSSEARVTLLQSLRLHPSRRALIAYTLALTGAWGVRTAGALRGKNASRV